MGDNNANPRRSRPVKAADAIKTMIVDEGLRAGDKLPSEADFIARFKMAKGTIREAMRILEAEGIITMRTGPGGGSFVKAVTEERASKLLSNYFYFQDLSIDEIYRVRRTIEPDLAGSLAGRLTAEQIRELEDILALYPSEPRSAEEEREHHIAALRFHRRLAEFADNRLLGFIIGFIARFLADLTVYRDLYRTPNQELWREGREHQKALVIALKDGDAAAARRIMRSHMTTAKRLMEVQAAKVDKRFIA